MISPPPRLHVKFLSADATTPAGGARRADLGFPLVMSRPLLLVVVVMSSPIAAACSSPSAEEEATDWPVTSGSSGAGNGGAGGATASTGSTSATGTGGAEGTGGAGGAGGGGPIEPLPTRAITLGGQEGWEHDDGFASGYFNTYDAIAVGGAGDTPRKIHVLLPRGYAASAARYPVVYMNDGNTTFWPGGLGNRSWEVAQRLEELYAENAIPRVIVVAIHPIERNREYTHVPWADGQPCCGVDAYTDYVADALKGWLDTWYRTRPERENTAILGSSRGGLASFYMANRRPDRFGKAACMSPSFWSGLDPVIGTGNLPGGPLATSALVTTLAPTLNDASIRPALWIDWGLVRTGGTHNSGIEAAATARGSEMVQLLEGTYRYVEGREIRSYEDPSGEHDESSWSRRFPSVMRALFGAR
jgi:pimeloyl-ACP methyl ester carboxylesterase